MTLWSTEAHRRYQPIGGSNPSEPIRILALSYHFLEESTEIKEQFAFQSFCYQSRIDSETDTKPSRNEGLRSLAISEYQNTTMQPIVTTNDSSTERAKQHLAESRIESTRWADEWHVSLPDGDEHNVQCNREGGRLHADCDCKRFEFQSETPVQACAHIMTLLLAEDEGQLVIPNYDAERYEQALKVAEDEDAGRHGAKAYIQAFPTEDADDAPASEEAMTDGGTQVEQTDITLADQFKTGNQVAEHEADLDRGRGQVGVGRDEYDDYELIAEDVDGGILIWKDNGHERRFEGVRDVDDWDQLACAIERKGLGRGAIYHAEVER